MGNNKLIHAGFTGSFDVSLEDGCLIGRVLFIDDIISYEGETVSDLKKNFEAAVDRYIVYCKQTGKPANKPYSGTFNVRVGPELHRKAVIAATEASVNLNEFVSKAILAAVKKDIAPTVVHNHIIKFETESSTRRFWSVSSHNPEKYSATSLQ